MQTYPLAPRPFQIEGIEFIRRKKRVLIHDKPGLGKTLEGVYGSEGKTLVVCPNYLTEQWYDWLNGVSDGPDAHPPFAPYDRQRIVWCKGSWMDRVLALQEPADFTIINMEMMQTHANQLVELAEKDYWESIIIDEAHHFRNHTAKRSDTIVKVAACCEYSISLTATPIWKEVDDLYMQFRIINPDIFTSYWKFVDLFCIADNTRYGTKIFGARKEMIPELDQMVQLVTLGRSYETAGREIPPVITKFVPVEFPPGVRKAYDDMVTKYRIDMENDLIAFDNYSQIMRAMRFLTAPVKYQPTVDIVEDCDPTQKIVIFCWYRNTANELASMLDSAVAIHGGITNPAERRRLALNSRIVVATIASLSEGIDLSAARTVIFVEEHYTPGSVEQALSRIVRERQTESNADPVLVYYVQVKKTIDEVIHAVTRRRNGTIQSVLKESLNIG